MNDLTAAEHDVIAELAAIYTTPAFLAAALQMGREETALLITEKDVELTPPKVTRLRALITRFEASRAAPAWRVVQLRTLAGMSGLQLARAAGVSWLRVSSLESGRHLNLSTLDAVCGALATQRALSWVRVDDLMHADLAALRERYVKTSERLDRGAARRRRQEKHDPLP